MPPGPRHSIDSALDSRFVTYSLRSWNAYEAVYTLQQLTCLAPLYTAELREMYGKSGLGDARRIWGAIADLASAITGLPSTMQSLLALGFEEAAEVNHLIEITQEFALSNHPILKPLDFRAANLGDIEPVLIHAVAHDRVAKPLLELFRDEMHAFDFEAMSSANDDKSQTFADLRNGLGDLPDAFPWWDGRPMFLEEQKAFLEYLARHVGAEVTAESLVDESLGMFILYMAGHVKRSESTGRVVLNHENLPGRLLGRPISLLCHQVGNTILETLKASRAKDVFGRLYEIESAVLSELDIDISSGLNSTRTLATERAVHEFNGTVIDIRESRSFANIQQYEWRDLEKD